jgi:hypothetical protein
VLPLYNKTVDIGVYKINELKNLTNENSIFQTKPL